MVTTEENPSPYDELQFHRSDMCVVWRGHACRLTAAEGTIFYNIWKARDWVGLQDIATNLEGRKIDSENLPKLIACHVSHIRRKLRENDPEIPVVIENQKQTFWMDPAYRLKY